jgi:hypothetical protein
MSAPHYFRPEWIEKTDRQVRVDLCVYGGTAAGVVAAVAAAQQGLSAVIVNPGNHLGGMTSGGLGWTDFGRKQAVGGMSLAFYQRVGKHYGKEAEWNFEPHVAEAVFDAMVKEAGVAVHHRQFLDAVKMEGKRIAEVRMLGGLRVNAKTFVDATYEGDLLAKAGVTYTVGREANSQYGETLNGIQVDRKHQFGVRVDPYVKEGDPKSGLLPMIDAEDRTTMIGKGDHRVQAYNFRMCMTDDPALKIDWPAPDGYDPATYELATRWFRGDKDKYNEQLWDQPHNIVGIPVPVKFDVFPNKTPGGHHKTDTNNHGPVSSDYIGQNWDWPEAGYEQREAIFQAHVRWQMGLYYHMANCNAIPERYRKAYAHWGLPKDEFKDTGHWPHQLYVREARRMVSDAVVTELDCKAQRKADDAVGLGSYNMDSHNCSRFVTQRDGQAWVLNDGDVQVPPTDPYGISYKCLVPRRGECENLIVPVCFSASHIAYGSARMEPVFMVLGQSSALAATIAIRRNVAMQDVPYAELRTALLDAGQVLDWQG